MTRSRGKQIEVSLEVALGDVVMVKHPAAGHPAAVQRTLRRRRQRRVVRRAPVRRHHDVAGLFERRRGEPDAVGRRHESGIGPARRSASDENLLG